MINSSIQWTDHTWNIARGCTKVNDDCKYCYMMRDSLNDTRYKGRVVERTKTVFNLPDRIKEKGAKLFVSSLTDWLHEDIDAFRSEMWQIMARNPHLIYQLLTKRAYRAIKNNALGQLPFPPHHSPERWPNVWFGVSAGNQKNFDGQMEHFRPIKAAVKWVSLEPLHGPIDNLRLKENGINWVVVGGESGNENGKWKYHACFSLWLFNIIKQCKDAGVPVFVKQAGTFLAKKYKMKSRHGGDITEWPVWMRIRQFPKSA